jgi:tRNA (cmo5U34)-methyltransferase
LTSWFSGTYTQLNMAVSDNTTPYTADEYDRSVVRTIPFYKTIQSEALNLVKIIQPGVETWLDTGCGTGYLVEKALDKFPQTRFYLADPSEGMLKQASRRLEGYSKGRISLLPPASSQELMKYRNQITPSVITAVLCHHYIQRLQRVEATRACYELLEKGGLYLTFEIVSPETQSGIQAALERWGRFQINHGRAGAVVREHLKRFNDSYFPITIQEHLSLLRETGFQVAELFWFSYLQAGLYAIK